MELTDRIYNLCEVVADIAYISGERSYYSGDSREDIADFIKWANEFDEKYKDVKWGQDLDYIDTIYDYTMEKIYRGDSCKTEDKDG